MGDDVEIEIVDVSGGRVKLRFDARRSIPIHRTELSEPKKLKLSATGRGDLEDLVLCLSADLIKLQAELRDLARKWHRDSELSSRDYANALSAILAPDDDPEPDHTDDCGTKYRGCSPDCTFQAWHDARSFNG